MKLVFRQFLYECPKQRQEKHFNGFLHESLEWSLSPQQKHLPFLKGRGETMAGLRSDRDRCGEAPPRAVGAVDGNFFNEDSSAFRSAWDIMRASA